MADKPEVGDLGYTPTIQVGSPWDVKEVADKLPGGRPAEGSSSPLPFFHMLERLKTTKREGWRRFGINSGESIADHMYRMSIISMFAPPELASRLDLNKCMKMCLIHDMAELLVGDITPRDGVPKDEKNRREAATMDYLTSDLLRSVGASGSVGKEMRAIWQEYEDAKTLDSVFVHDVDKMELLLQMTEYEKRAGGRKKLDLSEFEYVATKLELPETKQWAKELFDGQLKEKVDKEVDDYYARE
ncbi:HD domain-containing protein [Sarocladium implicatum]|nr:HD domain-containing protein [Sarocladium implicatum]